MLGIADQADGAVLTSRTSSRSAATMPPSVSSRLPLAGLPDVGGQVAGGHALHHRRRVGRFAAQLVDDAAADHDCRRR